MNLWIHRTFQSSIWMSHRFTDFNNSPKLSPYLSTICPPQTFQLLPEPSSPDCWLHWFLSWSLYVACPSCHPGLERPSLPLLCDELLISSTEDQALLSIGNLPWLPQKGRDVSSPMIATVHFTKHLENNDVFFLLSLCLPIKYLKSLYNLQLGTRTNNNENIKIMV